MKRTIRRKSILALICLVGIALGVTASVFAQGGRESSTATVASAGGAAGASSDAAGSDGGTASNAAGTANSAANPADTVTWHGLTVYKENAEINFPISHTDAEWHKILDPEQYDILRQAGTEPPFTGALLNEHRAGTFYSAATGEPLFSSKTKFESGTGWPSFYQPINQSNVMLRIDSSLFEQRVEVLDSASGSHLGHVFDDGPAPTGLRYCMDSLALLFVPEGGTPPAIVKQYQASHAGS